MSTEYEIGISADSQAAAWDVFVAGTPGGHHVQTSLWAGVKAPFGWRSSRIVVTRQGRIVAGAQLLARSVPFLGTVAYVPFGPLCATKEGSLTELIIDEIRRVCQRRNFRLLALQPPHNGQEMISVLANRGFSLSLLSLAPTASLLIDLSLGTDEILAGMMKRTRKSIRRSERQGITVHEGTESDLSLFYNLYLATSKRRKFRPYPREYFLRMWRILAPYGYIKLFLAKYEQDPISALLIVPFGNTVVAKIVGWSGLYAERRPNDALFWSSIQWAKSHAYSYYDFEGLDPAAAGMILRGESLPESWHYTPDFFKLGFGGRVVLYPQAYYYIPNPILSHIFRMVSDYLGDSTGAQKIVDLLRKR